ncbi:HAD family hydrolase [Shimia abyssi]|uniref:HAD superfamily hydrolase (TIGR01509 family) n=1 Tax=Shimia abyssi TaxID=1662395 RepID=A0A2P8FCK3_9RHOB|nr:HAD family phosphatase [Shimia abyssi]PSL19453.1 HAD superfamily hydrolase (TIGR01509 family) [Shimia abyssi]
MTLPAAFLFDMDGLLLDSERVMMKVFLELTDGLALDHEASTVFFLNLVGTSSAETDRRLVDFLPKEVKQDWFLAEFRNRYDVQSQKGIPLRPHAMEVVRHLHMLGGRMAVVTSTKGVLARRKLEKAGLLAMLVHVRAGDEVRANKPDPAPYIQAAEALNVHPADCIAFEDSDAGITAARAAGCRGFQIPDLRPPEQPFPDLGQEVVPDLRAALDRLGLWA